jgi:hypothetical protein
MTVAAVRSETGYRRKLTSDEDNSCQNSAKKFSTLQGEISTHTQHGRMHHVPCKVHDLCPTIRESDKTANRRQGIEDLLKIRLENI